MTNQGARKQVDATHSEARLRQARDFHASARNLVALGDTSGYNGAIALAVPAGIAYADALTARHLGVVNKQDHKNAPRLLREALGHRLPETHERLFRKLLGRKDEVSYGARVVTRDEAARLLEEMDGFAAWTETLL